MAETSPLQGVFDDFELLTKKQAVLSSMLVLYRAGNAEFAEHIYAKRHKEVDDAPRLTVEGARRLLTRAGL